MTMTMTRFLPVSLLLLAAAALACGGAEQPGACFLDGESTPQNCDPALPYVVATSSSGGGGDAGAASGDMWSCSERPADPCPVGDVCIMPTANGSSSHRYGVCR